jgi:hypothetical protein
MTRIVVAIVAMAIPRAAAADPLCDAGAVCPDSDHDGFAACGCALSGTPCDCDDADPSTFPGAPETCDATKDSNCSGHAPDPCPTTMGCLGSMCVPGCIPLDDFGCATGSSFAAQPNGVCLCSPKDCTVFGCPEGLTCDDSKTCVPGCAPDVRCPHGQICRGTGCVDPCKEVTCPAGAVCNGGRCLPSCACDPAASCPAGETCDLSAPVPACVETACAGVSCPAESHCENGSCVDDCAGVVCPPLRVCVKVSVNGGARQAKCADLCMPNPCGIGFVCDWRTAECVRVPTAEGGLNGPPDTFDPLEVAGTGWACSTSAVTRVSTMAGGGAFLAMALFVVRRWRRKRKD